METNENCKISVPQKIQVRNVIFQKTAKKTCSRHQFAPTQGAWIAPKMGLDESK